MNNKRIADAVIIAGGVFMVGSAVLSMRKTRKVEQAKRNTIVEETAIEMAAIHRATDIVNARIARGEIRDMETLRRNVLEEVSFQKIAIHEQM